ncbi:MAG: STAS domain-containing protein [Clostridiales bacterium]|nr:STAS domain-containing protein [Candidatus Equinaster intestinalis]
MNISIQKNGGAITLILDGWLDTMSSPELAAEVEKINSAAAIILDFSGVEYIASSGLRQVVAASRKAKEIGAEFSVINVCPEIMSIFALTGLEKKLSIKAK